MKETTLQQFEEKIREEFIEKHFDISGGEPVGTEQITDFFLAHFRQKLLSEFVKEVWEEIKKRKEENNEHTCTRDEDGSPTCICA